MFMSAISASFWVVAFDSEVALFLAFVTSHWLLDVFAHHDPGIGNEDSFTEEFVGSFCQ